MQLLNSQADRKERHTSDGGGSDAGNGSMQQQVQQQDPTRQLLVSDASAVLLSTVQAVPEH